jgi:REP-associated tyrosine transposase
MSRPLRIEYPDAWYHVMNRGRRAERIFSDDQDYAIFVELLRETSAAWNIRICAFCLMPNHYHLLVQTPDANIARSMRHINGVYTQRFNRRHGCDGQLFRGRYKSILVEADSYLLQLVRYIHRNPAQAGLAGLDRYPWSSHRGYLSVAKKWDWLHKRFVFQLLSNDKRQWITRYRRFMTREDDAGLSRLIESRQWPSVLGAKSFTDWIRGQYYHRRDDREILQRRELAPEPEEITSAVCNLYSIAPDALYSYQTRRI